MKQTGMRCLSVLLLTILWVPAIVGAGNTDSDIRETARLLAILFDSGRLVIGRNQEVINDPSATDKTFSPELFAEQTIVLFKQRTGHNLADLPNAAVPPSSKPLLERLLEESKKTVASYEPVLNMKGLKYKGLIPATFGTETATRFQKWSGVYLKQTAPEHLVRNPNNKPDPFEIAQMAKITDPSFSRNGEAFVSETLEEGKVVRILLPLFYEKACLSCHGEPKGERDISGYPKEGGRMGELGGVISVRIEPKHLSLR
jgi:hypothetical protein